MVALSIPATFHSRSAQFNSVLKPISGPIANMGADATGIANSLTANATGVLNAGLGIAKDMAPVMVGTFAITQASRLGGAATGSDAPSSQQQKRQRSMSMTPGMNGPGGPSGMNG